MREYHIILEASRAIRVFPSIDKPSRLKRLIGIFTYLRVCAIFSIMHPGFISPILDLRVARAFLARFRNAWKIKIKGHYLLPLIYWLFQIHYIPFASNFSRIYCMQWRFKERTITRQNKEADASQRKGRRKNVGKVFSMEVQMWI